MNGGLDMKISLPDKVDQIIKTLNAHGFEAYAVGGCIRDSILGRTPDDWDITTIATPEQVKAIFPRTIDTGIAHGTVTVMKEKEGFEVTTYRIDGEYEDHRHPKEVAFTRDLKEDLRRRDFTVNAMAYSEETGLIDCFSGLTDLKNKVIRCVGCAKERFEEDALRILRAVRFAAQLEFSLEAETKKAMKEQTKDLEHISEERIQTELVKLLISAHPEYLRYGYELGLTAVILPEFDALMETPQNTPYHDKNVGDHTLSAIQAIPKDRILRLSALFHDIGKPRTRKTDETGRDHFFNHPQIGSEMVIQILKRLKFDNATIKTVSRLVRWHDVRPELTQRGIRRAMNRIGPDIFPKLLEVKRADALAHSPLGCEGLLKDLKIIRVLYEKVLEDEDATSIKDLHISGKDLLSMGMDSGPHIGEILDEILEMVLEDPTCNHKIYLEKYVRERFHKFISPNIR